MDNNFNDFAEMDGDPIDGFFNADPIDGFFNADPIDGFFNADPFFKCQYQIDQASEPTFGGYRLFEDVLSSSNHSQLLTVRKEGNEQHKNGRNFQDAIPMCGSLRKEQFISNMASDSCDVSTLAGSPPSLSMSTMSSSDSSCSRATSSNPAASSAFSSPMTPEVVEENSRGVTIGKRLSFPMISQEKLEVLGNAIAWNRRPTADESRFLAAALSLHMDESSLAQLQKDLQMDERFYKKWSPSQTLRLGGPTRPVALRKQKIIRRALEREPAPSKVAVEFLAAGLRISVQQFWDAPMSNWKRIGGIRTKTKDSILLDPAPKEKSLSHSKDPVQPDISVDLNPTNQATSVVCITPPPSDSPTCNMSSLDSPPWDPLMSSNPKSIDPVDASITVQKSQYPPKIVDNLESSSKCEKSEKPLSEDVKMQDPPGIHDTLIDLVADEGQDQDEETESRLVNEVAAVLGPEYGHVAEFLISHIVSEPLGDLFQFEYGNRERPDGVGNTPSSTSSQTPGNASSPNTTASGSSGGKRKSAGGGNGGADPDDVEGDGNGDMPPPPKKKKSPSSPQPRFDCPIYRRALRMGGQIHVCAPNGLEFRNLWEHLRQSHYGCETCGLKLSEPRADKKHLREQKNDSSKCQANPGIVLLLEVGMEVMEQLEEVYFTPPNVLTNDEKWVKFWKLLFPQDAEADIPDPRHQDTITFSTVNIPTLQETMHKMWIQNPRLRPLDDEEKQEVSSLLDRLLRTLPVIRRSRYQNTQPRTPRGPAAAVTWEDVAHAAGHSPLYHSGQDNLWDANGDDLMANYDNTFNNNAQGFHGSGYMH